LTKLFWADTGEVYNMKFCTNLGH